MTKVTLDFDDQTLDRVASVANARHISVEDLLKARAKDIARLAPIEIINPSHQAIVAAAARPTGYYESRREEIYDRENARAELYVESKRRLLDLIDETDGDMGAQGWDRRRAYER